MQIQPLAEQFYLCLEAEKASSPLTIEAYRADMKSFLGFLQREEIAPELDSLATAVLRNYLSDMTRRGLKQRAPPSWASLLLAIPREHGGRPLEPMRSALHTPTGEGDTAVPHPR